MIQSLQQLRHQLFSGRRYEHSLGGVGATTTPGRGSEWVLSRGFCSYHLIDLSRVERKLRPQALETQLETLSPYDSPGHFVSWVDGLAQVWVWDSRLVEENLATHLVDGDEPELVSVIPESVFTPKIEEGLQVCQGVDGLLLQYWQSGVLRQERFWQEAPTRQQLERFTRGLGLDPKLVPDVSSPVAKGETAWKDVARLGAGWRLYEPVGVLAVVSLAGLILAFQLTTLIGTTVMTALLEADVRSMESAIDPVLAARERTLDERDMNHLLSQLDAGSQLELMTRISGELPAPDTSPEDTGDSPGRISRWMFQEDEVSFTIKSPVADLREYAAGLDRITGIGEVELVPNDRAEELVVNARVTP